MDTPLKLLIASKVNWNDRITDALVGECQRLTLEKSDLLKTIREVRTLAYQLNGGERIHVICTRALEGA